jgi:hypothetical protein
MLTKPRINHLPNHRPKPNHKSQPHRSQLQLIPLHKRPHKRHHKSQLHRIMKTSILLMRNLIRRKMVMTLTKWIKNNLQPPNLAAFPVQVPKNFNILIFN